MHLEQMQMLINGVDKAYLPDHGVNGADASMANTSDAISDLITNIIGGEHRLIATDQVGLVQTLLDPTLAVGQFRGYSRVHSKSSWLPSFGKAHYFLKPRKGREISSFFVKNCQNTKRGTLG
jgi:hypothetical protein